MSVVVLWPQILFPAIASTSECEGGGLTSKVGTTGLASSLTLVTGDSYYGEEVKIFSFRLRINS